MTGGDLWALYELLLLLLTDTNTSRANGTLRIAAARGDYQQ